MTLRAGMLCAALLIGGAAPAISDCAVLPAADQVAPVITLDVAAEDVPRPVPLLRLYADGRIEARHPDGLRRARMARADLQALLTRVVEGEAFMTLDSAVLAKDLGNGGDDGTLRMRVVADGPLSYVALTLPGCAHAVTVQGSAFRADERRDVAALQRFRRVEVALLEILTQVQRN